ncbi:pentapeptide repeat-containing protein [Nocardia africana]|uniref:Pentapeptide repeat-containing protein n=1 Tax=Nocardia africana TaxID=134964 RepID=A0ABW6NNK4_9NOCA
MATAVGTLGATLTAAVALWFTAQSLRATNNQYALSEQVAVTDRFRLAAEQLASDKINVRISGIYLLERLAKDSTADHPTVFSVLEAFVRTQTGAAACGDSEARPDAAVEPPADIQTALTVIGRRDASRDGDHRVDLSRTCLNGATLNGAHLAGADLTGVRLIGAALGRVDLTGATLNGTRFAFADLTEANLGNDDLTGTDLHRADLTGARLTGANLTGVHLTSTKLSEADLVGAKLTGALLTGADLRNVKYDESTEWPAEFAPPPR